MCDHGHGNGGGCSNEVADVVQAEEGMRYDLRQFIDMDKLSVLNEVESGTGRFVFKPHDQRLDRSTFCESDSDEELLFNIPFTGHVKILGISIVGEPDEQHPARVRVFKDREGMSFDDAAVAAEQEIDLKQDPEGKVDYPLKASKFGNVAHLTLYFDRNFGAETTKIFYIGLRGEYVQDFRQQVVIATYESRALPSDHKAAVPDGAQHGVF